jgi:membrane associated rhomboid family serine protease
VVIARRRPSFLVTAWIVVGVVIAATYDYFDRLETAGGVASAVVAALLWPLVILGFDVRISR